MSELNATAPGALLEKYDGLYKGMASRKHGSTVSLREKSWERFRELGFPRDGDESWKYTKPSKLAAESLKLSQEDTPLAFWKELIDKHMSPPSETYRIVFANAQYIPELSSLKGLAQGLIVQSLWDAIAENKSPISSLWADGAGQEDRALTALNGALFDNGAWIHLSQGCKCDKAVEVVFLSGGQAPGLMSNPRIVIQMDEGSRAEIQEIYVGGQENHYFTNAVSQVYLGQGSHLDHLRLQIESGDAQHISSLAIHQARNSFYGSHNIGIGAALARTDLVINLEGPGAECELNGLSLGQGSQHGDIQTQVRHAAPHGTSRQFFKIILDDKSTGVFNGGILVLREGQKTVASQENRNLLLSKSARINTKPQLEIFADDVKCNHGDTVGSLDENAIFYLRSRGLRRSEAKKILIQAFAQDAFDSIPKGSFRSLVEFKIKKWFESRVNIVGAEE